MKKRNDYRYEVCGKCGREHHRLAHTNEKKLFEDYHIYGIKLDEYLVKKLGL